MCLLLAQALACALLQGGFMLLRVVLVTIVTTALLTSGCSSGKPSVPAPAKSSSAQASPSKSATAEETTAADAAPAEKLDVHACADVTAANLDLATASTAEDALKAGDAFEQYDLPADVKDAVEHFVGTNGAQFDDPDYDKYNKTIDEWVKQVCPLG
jgi:hypothetical protein